MKLQLQDLNGQVIEEKEIILGENDMLVMFYDNEKISLEEAQGVFNVVEAGLNTNTNIIGIPFGIEFSVIKKQNL